MQDVGGRLKCTVCSTLLPPGASEKQIKQHLKSITHKRGAAQPAAPPPPQQCEEAAGSGDESEELQMLRRLISSDDPPSNELLEPYARNLSRFLALYPDATATGCSAPLPPPVLRQPKKECPALDMPFLTPQCGTVPLVPGGVDEVLRHYFTARRDAHPKVDVDEADQEVASWAEARKALQAADAANRRFWCTFFVPGIAAGCERAARPLLRRPGSQGGLDHRARTDPRTRPGS